ncbi:hypothetical protein K1719_019687 [Acacia pycnantha]|nr:hypothetical protein K1719_019687 [Acacia pycnantha]
MMMMSSLKLLLIFGAALGLYQFNAQNTNHLPSVVPQYNTNKTDQLTTPTPALRLNPGFDYFLFVLQWPAAFCNIQRSYPQGQRCNPDPVLPEHRIKFTVHGLWPQLHGVKSPLFCKTTRFLHHADLIPLQKRLLEYWPNLFSAQKFQPNQDYFWRNEWNKHGTCSSNKFPTPTQYLNIALDLARNYARPIYDELHNQRIIPDGTSLRRLEVLREIVMGVTGAYPVLKIGVNSSGHHLLHEIQLCVRKDGVTLMDCEGRCIFAAPYYGTFVTCWTLQPSVHSQDHRQLHEHTCF